MKPEKVGNYVLIGGTRIPAVNIQVEGVPGFINGEWYGIYFEIMFEDGKLWVVEQGSEHIPIEGAEAGFVFMQVEVMEYPRFALTGLDNPGVKIMLKDWEDFLNLYNEKKLASWC